MRSLLLLTTAALAFTSADALACGGYRSLAPDALPAAAHEAAERDAVEAAVVRHFTAIQQADRQALRALWDLQAGEVSQRDADGSVVVTTPVRQNIRTWTQAPAPDAAWQIHDITVDGASSTVEASLTWNGSAFDETLTLVNDGGGWTLVAKAYTVTSAAPAFPSGGMGY